MNGVSDVKAFLSFSSGLLKVVECVPHPTPKGEKEVARRAGARRATSFSPSFAAAGGSS